MYKVKEPLAEHPRTKSVRAALVLLPLLGITNSFNMMTSPVHRSPLEFGLWSYSTTFLRSCQGLFVCCIYCFFNDEVKRTLRHFWKRRMAARRGCRRRSNRSTSLFDNPSLLDAARRQSSVAARLRTSLDSQITIAPLGRRRQPSSAGVPAGAATAGSSSPNGTCL
ncbi:PDF receptor [Amphibalanus amphitrite]|uniref:PDF receptor n=1 Tax=Amphibalanus amphitrite TaxID=1232801 RepID=A0A6A4UXW9_AMPAM|nr:PDF receptor [Amphibalanus amphitrite]